MTEVLTVESSAVATTAAVPNRMNGRRPNASTQAPISGWQRIPAAL